jgi:hypothetical protein
VALPQLPYICASLCVVCKMCAVVCVCVCVVWCGCGMIPPQLLSVHVCVWCGV